MIKKTIVVLSLIIVAFGAWHFAGAIYIGADKPHWAITTQILHRAMERSVKYHSKSLMPPATNDSLVKFGFGHFHAMCVMCHGAPGFERSEIGKGLTPPAPDLQKALGKWNSTESYWIVQHGIKMTGMPSFGVTHSNDELTAIVSFLQRFPGLSESEYQDFLANPTPENYEPEELAPEPGHGHIHGEHDAHGNHCNGME
jgi:mono/diheme cytochrome c family protein